MALLDFSFFPARAKTEVPVVYTIRWCAFQDRMKIEEFDVTIIKSNLNLMNAKSLIQYRMKGTLLGDAQWKPFIKEVHHSEKFLSKSVDSEIDNDVAEIQITPIVALKEVHDGDVSSIPFKFVNEHWVQSTQWGMNNVRFVCDQFNASIKLMQLK